MRISSFFHRALAVCLLLCALTSLFACKNTEELQIDAGEPSLDEESYTGIGEGEKSFLFTVVDLEGKTQIFLVSTNAETVGEALTENGIIEGEDGPYGLYVKKVCGIEADYEKHGKYWAFYVNGEYAMSGVDTTKIDTEKTASYAFKAE